MDCVQGRMCPRQCASDSTSGEGVWREGGESSFILAFEDHVSVNHEKLLLFESTTFNLAASRPSSTKPENNRLKLNSN